MTRIVTRCPFYAEATTVHSPAGAVEVIPYQAIIYIRLQFSRGLSPRFPAIVDIGHSHNLSIRDDHLQDWLGIQVDELKAVGRIKLSGRDILLRRAEIALCRNTPGTRTFANEPLFPLTTFGGISVLGSSDSLAPRLPLLGMRALVRDGLRLIVDGKRKYLTIHKPWF